MPYSKGYSYVSSRLVALGISQRSQLFAAFFLTNFTFVCDTWAAACLSFPFNNPVFEIGSSSKEGGCLRRAMALPQLESHFDAGKK
jgi:hypothetical protein